MIEHSTSMIKDIVVTFISWLSDFTQILLNFLMFKHLVYMNGPLAQDNSISL